MSYKLSQMGVEFWGKFQDPIQIVKESQSNPNQNIICAMLYSSNMLTVICIGIHFHWQGGMVYHDSWSYLQISFSPLKTYILSYIRLNNTKTIHINLHSRWLCLGSVLLRTKSAHQI